jgi:hypothetical protein
MQLEISILAVVDGGCRCRDSRHRRPSSRHRRTELRLIQYGRRSAACRAGQPARSLRQLGTARRPTASLRTDYRKMEKDHRRNGMLPRKLQRDHFRRRLRRKRDGRLWKRFHYLLRNKTISIYLFFLDQKSSPGLLGLVKVPRRPIINSTIT